MILSLLPDKITKNYLYQIHLIDTTIHVVRVDLANQLKCLTTPKTPTCISHTYSELFAFLYYVITQIRIFFLPSCLYNQSLNSKLKFMKHMKFFMEYINTILMQDS